MSNLKDMSDDDLQRAKHDAQMALAMAFIQTASVAELLELVAAIEAARATRIDVDRQALQALGGNHA